MGVGVKMLKLFSFNISTQSSQGQCLKLARIIYYISRNPIHKVLSVEIKLTVVGKYRYLID